MRQRDARPRSDAVECVQAMLAGCVIAVLLTASVAAASVVSTVQLGPKVGDLFRFHPSGEIAPGWHIPVQRAGDHRQCMLQPAVMAADGGSLVVERRLADDWTYQVHWAGRRTSNDRGDCGHAAELQIDRPALQSLQELGGIGQTWQLIGF